MTSRFPSPELFEGNLPNQRTHCGPCRKDGSLGALVSRQRRRALWLRYMALGAGPEVSAVTGVHETVCVAAGICFSR